MNLQPMTFGLGAALVALLAASPAALAQGGQDESGSYQQQGAAEQHGGFQQQGAPEQQPGLQQQGAPEQQPGTKQQGAIQGQAQPKGLTVAPPMSQAPGNISAKVVGFDDKKQTVLLEVPVSPKADIRRDGLSAGLDDLKKGDEVRASYDPRTKELTSVYSLSPDVQKQVNKQANKQQK